MTLLKFSILILSISIINFCFCCESKHRCDQNIDNLVDECSAEDSIIDDVVEENFESKSNEIDSLRSHIRMQEEKITELEEKIRSIENSIINILGVAKLLGKSSRIFWETLEFRFHIVPCLRTKICFSLPTIVC